jgi:hypothetical protein
VRVNDPDRGAAVSLVHLLVQDGAWTAVTVAMADHLVRDRPGGHLLRDLGLVVVLLELCGEQRAEHGGLSAETTRGAIAERAGLMVDCLDDCNQILEHAGLLRIERRRAANGGRNLASTYTLNEVPTISQSGERVTAGPQTSTGRAEDEYRQGGISATFGTGSPPSNARTGDRQVEKAVETLPPSGERGMKGGGDLDSAPLELCEALISAWAPALGESPRRAYVADRERWLAAAGELLERHPRGRLQHALDYMLGDEILGSRALTLPDFARVADQLLARHYARGRRAGGQRAPGSADAMGWPAARELLERAVQRHGRDHRAGALAELTKHSELLSVFVERVRWSTLCEQPMRYSDRRYSQLWNQLILDNARAGGEAAA